MGMTREQMDRIIDQHFAFEAADDVDGVLGSLAEGAEHEIVPSPFGRLTDRAGIRRLYELLFRDLKGEGVTPVRRLYGDGFVVDEAVWRGHIADGRQFHLDGRGGQASFRLLHIFEFRDGQDRARGRLVRPGGDPAAARRRPGGGRRVARGPGRRGLRDGAVRPFRTIAALAVAGTSAAATPAALSQQQSTPRSRGEYLATIMDCGGCHTGGALAGQPDPKLHLAGSGIGFGIPGLGVFYPPNLTPDRETGLGAWSEADVVRAVRTGVRPDGRMLAPVMPRHNYAGLTDGDARALAAYLKGFRPVRNATPPVTGAGETPPAPYLAVVAPPGRRPGRGRPDA